MEHKITTLLNWCTINGIQIDKRLRLVPDVTGLAVYSGSTLIEASQTLVKIPKTAVLSVKSCSASQFIESSPYGLEAQLALSLALLIEIQRGTSSRWYGYLQSLPETMVDLPVFWDLEIGGRTLEDGMEALKWLKGTEVQKLLAGPDGNPLIESIRKYFNEIVVPTTARFSMKIAAGFLQPTFHQFCRAFSLVSSRAFLVDAYHGLSMVPIADAFNHLDDHRVHLETEYEVCPECGSLQQCPHDQSTELSSNHPTPNNSNDKPIQNDDTYDMVSNATISPHSEVFNTYGETTSNAQLLAQYGFSLDVNENDSISWDFDDLINFLEAGSQARDLSASLGLPWNILSDSFDEDVFSESELVFKPSDAAFCINCEGKISWQLWLVIVSHKCARLVPANQVAALSSELGRYHISREKEDFETDIGGMNNSLLQEIACTVVKLCQHYKVQLGAGKDQESLGNLLDSLSQPRTKLALLQVITEFSIVDSCEAGWQDLCGE
ncbi:hypothetical protein DFH05DRAFT_799461 [Lentinula detonsa]|uniref:SET domain-containing protein n=1 Tax=Lentinula detonsa TaxID=2804962 RepID=A0A9W8TZZ4_9AGAR|nr:hypothetical protein DFH05DRAFT_799461 [Lentinula detonsa]